MGHHENAPIVTKGLLRCRAVAETNEDPRLLTVIHAIEGDVQRGMNNLSKSCQERKTGASSGGARNAGK